MKAEPTPSKATPTKAAAAEATPTEPTPTDRELAKLVRVELAALSRKPGPLERVVCSVRRTSVFDPKTSTNGRAFHVEILTAPKGLDAAKATEAIAVVCKAHGLPAHVTMTRGAERSE